MASRREELQARLDAFVADFVDGLIDAYGDDADLGSIVLVAETKVKRSPEEIEAIVGYRPRPEALYTPEAEWRHEVSVGSTDLRDWVKLGLLRAAIREVEEPWLPPPADEGDDA